MPLTQHTEGDRFVINLDEPKNGIYLVLVFLDSKPNFYNRLMGPEIEGG
ncbi:MAG: hypothetical protein ACTJFN_14325 [Sphingobacterium sp.]